MKIVVLGDTHNRHDQIEVPDGDLLIHAGDFTLRGNLVEVTKFLDWFENQPHQFKVFIAGNHDFLFEDQPGIARGLVEGRNFYYLQDSSVIFDNENLKIFGSPWQPWFHNWAFNLQRGEEIARKWNQIPNDIDILVTHGPPHGILDFADNSVEHVGCEELKKKVLEIKPKIHIFGHIHEAYGVEEGDYTLFVNGCNCNLDYEVVNKPVVLLKDDGGVWEVEEEREVN